MPETTIPSGRRNFVRGQKHNALPLFGLGLAVIANAVWIGFLGYCILKLI
jgi:hypothetical protein